MWRNGSLNRGVVGQVKRRRFDWPGEICTLGLPRCKRPADVLHPPLSGNLQIPAEGFPEVEPSTCLLFRVFGNSLLIGPKVYRLAADPKMRLKEERGGCKLTVVFGCELGEKSDANVCSQFGPKAAEIAVDDAEVEGHPRDVRSSGRDVGARHENGTSAVGLAKMNHHTVIRALSSSCIRGLRRQRGERFKGRCIPSIAFDSPERFGYSFGVNGFSLKRRKIAASGGVGRRCPTLHLDDL